MGKTLDVHTLHKQFCKAYATVRDELHMATMSYGVFAPIIVDAEGATTLDCFELSPAMPWVWGLNINEVLDLLLPEIPIGVYLSLIRGPYLIGVFLDANLSNAIGFRTPIDDLEAPPSQYVDVYDALPTLASIGGRQTICKH